MGTTIVLGVAFVFAAKHILNEIGDLFEECLKADIEASGYVKKQK